MYFCEEQPASVYLPPLRGHGLSRSLRLSPRSQWASPQAAVWASQFSPLNVLQNQQSLCDLALGRSWLLLGFLGMVSTEAFSLQPHHCLHLVSGSWLLGTVVTPFGCLHRLHFGNRILALLNLAVVFCLGC